MKFSNRSAILSGVSVLLLATVMLPFSLPAQDVSDIPPPSKEPPARIRIPMNLPEEQFVEGEAEKPTDAEIAAFSLAATAKGWIPEDSSGRLLNGMMVRVTVMVQGRIEHASEAQRITHSGKIGLPLLQNVEIGDMNLEDAEEMLTERYSEYYVEPLVNIAFVGETNDPSQSPWGYVTMMGNIGSPGPLAMPPTQLLTISGAVKLAGGLTASAKGDAIRIFRPHPEDETVEIIKVDLSELARSGKKAEDVNLKAGDVVFIPERIF